ncbi:MAG: transketolase family protein [Candidatus Saccharimonadales bacterium]
MNKHHLVADLQAKDIKQESNRKGFGRGLLKVGKQHDKVVGLCADLSESTQMKAFADEFPDRFVQVGVAEQNLVTTASGLAAMGKIPFASSYAAFCPGRCWEQIRTTICLNERPVKIVGSHTGLSVGPDGATHQMLEDIALMRSLPHMKVFAPCDALEAERITLAMVKDPSPNYIRLSRADTPVFTTDHTPFEIGKAYVYREGHDVTIVSTGGLTYQALLAAEILEKDGIHAEVIHVPTIKPLDDKTILASAQKTRAVVTCEEGQIAAGLGGTVAELLSERLPTPMKRVGMQDRFGESGQPDELAEHFGLTAIHIAMNVHHVLDHKKIRGSK